MSTAVGKARRSVGSKLGGEGGTPRGTVHKSDKAQVFGQDTHRREIELPASDRGDDGEPARMMVLCNVVMSPGFITT